MADKIAELQVVIEAQTAAFTKGIQEAQAQLQKLNQTAQNSSSGVGAIAKNFEGLQGTFFRIQNTIGAVNAGFTALAFVGNKLASFVQLGDKLRVSQVAMENLFDSTERAKEALDNMFDLAESADISLSRAADAFKKIANSTKDMGASNEQIRAITASIFQLAKVSGKQEDAGAFLNQINIAMTRGTLAAGQWNRMTRQMPEMANLLAKAFGVTTTEFTRMVKTGEISAAKLANTLIELQDPASDLQKKIAEFPKTFEDELERTSRILEQFQKDLYKAFGGKEGSSFVGEFFGAFNDELVLTLDQLKRFAKFISENWVVALNAAGAATLTLAAAYTSVLAPAIVAATVAVKTFFAAIGPIGWVILALTAIATNWENIVKWGNLAVSVVLEYAAKAAKVLGASGLAESLSKEAEGFKKIYKEIDDKQKETLNKAKQAFKADLQNTTSPAAEAMESWRQALKKAREELDLVPKKINELEKEISSLEKKAKTDVDFVFLQKLKGDLVSLKSQLAAGNPIKMLGVELEKIGSTEGVSAQERITAITNTLLTLYEAGKLTAEGAKALAKQLDDAYKAERIDRLGPEIAALDEQLRNQQKTFDILGDKIAFVNEKIKEMVDQGVPEDSPMLEYLRKMQEELTKTKDKGVADFLELRDAVAGFSKQFANEFVDNLMKGKIAFDGFAKGLLNTIVKTMMNQMVTKFIDSFMGGGKTSFGASFLGGLFKNANGNAFMSGLGLPYGIYNKPTFFEMPGSGPIQKFAKGGVLGEAGPEAIMPLKRGADGKLGVAGGGTTINVINNAGVEVQTAESSGADGSRVIDITIEKKVREMFGSGSMDKTMRASYGLTRSAV